MERIPLTFKTDSPLKKALVEQRAAQLDRSVSDYIQLVLKVHFGLAAPELLIPPDGKLAGLTPEQAAILEAAARVLRERDGQQSPDAAAAIATVKSFSEISAKPASGPQGSTPKPKPRRPRKSRQR